METRSKDAWCVGLNDITGYDSDEMLNCVYATRQQDALSFTDGYVHKSIVHTTTFDELPADIQQAALNVVFLALKMRSGQINRYGNRIDLKNITESITIILNGASWCEEGFKEVDINAFASVRV